MEQILQKLDFLFQKKKMLIYFVGVASGIGFTLYFSESLLKKFSCKSEFIKKLI